MCLCSVEEGGKDNDSKDGSYFFSYGLVFDNDYEKDCAAIVASEISFPVYICRLIVMFARIVLTRQFCVSTIQE